MGGVLGKARWERSRSKSNKPNPSLSPAAQTISLPACAAPATMALTDILLFPLCNPPLQALPMGDPFSFWCQFKCPLLREAFCDRGYAHICPPTSPQCPPILSSWMASYSKHLGPPVQALSVTHKRVSLVSVKWTRCTRELTPPEAALNQYRWSGSP